MALSCDVIHQKSEQSKLLRVYNSEKFNYQFERRSNGIFTTCLERTISHVTHHGEHQLWQENVS